MAALVDLKALSVRQPWASLIADGTKKIELRSWSTTYRGPLLICASKGMSQEGKGIYPESSKWPRGCAVAIVQLVDVRPWNAGDYIDACTKPSDERPHFSWHLELLFPTRPVPVSGRLSLFSVSLSPSDALRRR